MIRPKRPAVMFEGYWGRADATVEATGAWPKGLPRPARAELKIARRGLAAQGVPYPGQRNKLLGLIRRRTA